MHVTCVRYLQSLEEGIIASRVGVPGGYMVPDVDAGKRTPVLWKSRKHS